MRVKVSRGLGDDVIEVSNQIEDRSLDLQCSFFGKAESG